MNIEKKVLIPTLKWHQNKDYVFINIDISNFNNVNIRITEKDLL